MPEVDLNVESWDVPDAVTAEQLCEYAGKLAERIRMRLKDEGAPPALLTAEAARVLDAMVIEMRGLQVGVVVPVKITQAHDGHMVVRYAGELKAGRFRLVEDVG